MNYTNKVSGKNSVFLGHPGLVKDKIMWRRMLKLFIQKNKLMTQIKYVNVCLSKLRVCPLKVSAKNVILIKTY